MATPIWISNDGDWNNTASWSTGSVPVSTDTAVFDGVNSVVSVTGGLNQTGIDLANLQISPEYTGDIGLTGNPLQLDTDAVIHRGTGTLHYKGDGGVSQIRVDSTNLIDAAVLSGTASTWQVHVKKGRVTCTDTMATSGSIFSIIAMSDKSIVIIEKNGAELATGIIVNAGFVENNRGVSAADSIILVNGGTYVHEDGAVRNLHVLGGVAEWNANETLTSAIVEAGLLDFTRSGNEKTVTLLTILPGAEVFTTSQTTIAATVDYRKEIP